MKPNIIKCSRCINKKGNKCVYPSIACIDSFCSWRNRNGNCKDFNNTEMRGYLSICNQLDGILSMSEEIEGGLSIIHVKRDGEITGPVYFESEFKFNG